MLPKMRTVVKWIQLCSAFNRSR